MKLFSILSDWQCVEMRGPDAKDFLHRVTSASFARLRPGQFTAATLLAPTGKIQLYFKAILVDEEHYLLLSPEGATAAFNALEKMHFRENFKITPEAQDFSYLRILGDNPPRALAAFIQQPKGSVLKMDGGILVLQEGRWNEAPVQVDFGMLVPNDKLASIQTLLEADGFIRKDSLEAFRVRAADPRFPNELGPTTMPLEVALDDAVHENKGCYPGQEVIERIRSMGQTPRHMVVVHGDGAAPLTPILVSVENAGDAGQLTSAEQNPLNPNEWIGLALVKRIYVKPESKFTVDGNPVRVELKVKAQN